MSHTTVIKSVKMTSVTALQAAVLRLQERGITCTLEEGGRPRMYYNHQEVECDYVLRLPRSKYDVGFAKQADGSYAPIFDEYAGHIAGQLKNPSCPLPKTAEDASMACISLLTQEYGRAAMIETATVDNFYLAEETQHADGEYELAFERYTL